MSTKYKCKNIDGCYFVSFATVGWVDVFTRKEYKNVLVENLKYCQREKGLEIFAWCIMSNHVHLIARAAEGFLLHNILRDYKKHTSKVMIKAITENKHESRKDWMLSIFSKAGKANSGNEKNQFWRQDNHPIEVWSEDVINQKLTYLHNNPIIEGYVDKAEEYLYSSARDYFYDKHCGLIDIKFITE
jgi:REP element-mobilizing transposase RayT